MHPELDPTPYTQMYTRPTTMTSSRYPILIRKWKMIWKIGTHFHPNLNNNNEQAHRAGAQFVPKCVIWIRNYPVYIMCLGMILYYSVFNMHNEVVCYRFAEFKQVALAKQWGATPQLCLHPQ